MNEVNSTDSAATPGGSALEVFFVALRLGMTAFGGPAAHLAYFRDEYVVRRQWVTEGTYADLIALSQCLPGSSSSEVGISIGMVRAGLPGGLAAWLGFTLPSAIGMAIFGFTAATLGEEASGWLHALVVVSVAVVAVAVYDMARRLAPDRIRATIAVTSAIFIIAAPIPKRLTTVLIIAAAGLLGWWLLRKETKVSPFERLVPYGRRAVIVAAVLFFGFLVLLPIAREATNNYQAIAVADSFYRSGALVFGGGNVVMPLVQSEVVPAGWVTDEQFLAGFGIAQALPGPLFALAAYVGAAMQPDAGGILLAVVALVGLYLPSILFIVAALPSFGAIRSHSNFQAALRGVNACVVGILLAALYKPLWTSAILDPLDFAWALGAFALMMIWKIPPWVVVLLTASVGALIAGIT